MKASFSSGVLKNFLTVVGGTNRIYFIFVVLFLKSVVLFLKFAICNHGLVSTLHDKKSILILAFYIFSKPSFTANYFEWKLKIALFTQNICIIWYHFSKTSFEFNHTLWDIITPNQHLLVKNRQKIIDLHEVYTQKKLKIFKKCYHAHFIGWPFFWSHSVKWK